jgi:hypothetical protein
MTRPLKITRLRAFDDHFVIDEWFSDPEQLVFGEAEELIADRCRVDLDAVEYDGDFFVVHGAPVAFLQTEFRRVS